MKNSTVSAIAISAIVFVALSGCSGPKSRVSSQFKAQRQSVDINEVFSRGVELHALSDCRRAIPLLSKAAYHGPGYEDAQWRLGECLMQRDKPAITSTVYLEGLTWIRRSAEAGWPEAQGRLATVYTQESAMRPVEAAMWLTLYDRNLRRSRIGFVPLPAKVLMDTREHISASQMAEGRALADAWTKSVWKPPIPPQDGSIGGTGHQAEGGKTGRGRSGKGRKGERPLS